MNVYAKVNFRNEYISINIAKAIRGYREMGANIIPYHHIKEIINEITKEDIVLDYIHQTQLVFKKFNCDYEMDTYPSCFNSFYGRKIWKDYLSNVDQNDKLWPIFIKSVKDKVFTGKIIKSTKDLIGCGLNGEDVEIYCNEIVEFKAEYRMFVLYDEIQMISFYKGDFYYTYDSKIIDEIMSAFKTWEKRPKGCSIDIGVDSKGRTLVIEVNDGYSLGAYGCFEIPYAKIISARFSQLMNVQDSFDFRHYRIL